MSIGCWPTSDPNPVRPEAPPKPGLCIPNSLKPSRTPAHLVQPSLDMSPWSKLLIRGLYKDYIWAPYLTATGLVSGVLTTHIAQLPPGRSQAEATTWRNPSVAYSRLQKVGTRIKDDLCWFSFFLRFEIGGRTCSDFLASTVRLLNPTVETTSWEHYHANGRAGAEQIPFPLKLFPSYRSWN